MVIYAFCSYDYERHFGFSEWATSDIFARELLLLFQLAMRENGVVGSLVRFEGRKFAGDAA